MKVKMKMKKKHAAAKEKSGVIPVSEEMPKKKKAYDSLESAKKQYQR